MNAITKGVSLGIYNKEKGKGVEAAQGGSQPYVDLMGRRYVAPILCCRSGQDSARVLRLVLFLWRFKFLCRM